MKPRYLGISIFLLSTLFSWPVSGQFHVIPPEAPVIASVGEEAVLSCHLSPETDAEDMEVTWLRMDTLAEVHRYAAFQDQLQQQNLQYKRRTAFLKENIKTGQVALSIFPIHPSDNGQYSCYFTSSTFENEAQVTLLVTASGVSPQIHIVPWNTGQLKLTCTSTGWYPEPEVQWRDLQGKLLRPESETKTADGNGLFHVESSIIIDTESKAVSCVTRNPVLSEEKEAHVSVTDALFPKLWPWIVGFTVPLCLLAAGTTFCILFVRARRQPAKLAEKLVELTTELAQRKALGEDGLQEVRRFKGKCLMSLKEADIRLDEDTAHPDLSVSMHRSYVVFKKRQAVPDNAERFDTLRAVLGKNCFSAGDHYWEVKVKHKNKWELGLCEDSVTRKGDVSVCPENGFWALSLENNEYKALSTPPSILNVPKHPRIVGIFLQYEKGLISFYNVTDQSFLYTFKIIFTKSLRPYFNLGPYIRGNYYGLFIKLS